MIQLANDPNAARTPWRAAGHAGELSRADASRSRPGHPWPFLSHAERRPKAQGDAASRPTNNDIGS